MLRLGVIDSTLMHVWRELPLPCAGCGDENGVPTSMWNSALRNVPSLVLPLVCLRAFMISYDDTLETPEMNRTLQRNSYAITASLRELRCQRRLRRNIYGQLDLQDAHTHQT